MIKLEKRNKISIFEYTNNSVGVKCDKMKFKIYKGTDTFQKLIYLRYKCTGANQLARDLSKEFGAQQYCLNNHPMVIAGGLSAIKLKDKPKGWRKAFNSNDLFFPANNNHIDLKKIQALPLVESDELNVILGYEDQNINVSYGKSIWQTHPNVNWKFDDYILISMHELSKFVPNSDTIEITISEYNSLTK